MNTRENHTDDFSFVSLLLNYVIIDDSERKKDDVLRH
jgi:hypothetical protein